jgi:hypothetical protein
VLTMQNAMAPIISDVDILEHYPLPIAHEYQQLLEEKLWWDKCQQLKDVLDSSLRYCALIAISGYFEGQLMQADEVLDQWLVRKLVRPSLRDLVDMLERVMAVYQGKHELLMMPELYRFCCDSEAMRRMKRLTEELIRSLVSRTDEDRHRELYEVNAPRVNELLQQLAFLRDYTFLRIISGQEMPQGAIWQVQTLMGSEIRREVERWEMEALPEKVGIALWDGSHRRLLPLHPFALFEECPECNKAFYTPPEELFLYQETKGNEIIYVGLRESHGLTHRMPKQETVEDLRIVLRVEAWPPGVVGATGMPPRRLLDWAGVRGLAVRQSQEQLSRYQKEKYQTRVYLQRAEVEGHFAGFLNGEQTGFLIVGDSGTGKTNVLCHLTEERLKGADIVLFYNCAELPVGEGLNLGQVVAKHLGEEADFATLLDWLDRIRSEERGNFLLVLDALNENREPQRLLESLWEDVLAKIPVGQYGWFRVVASCRTEAWRRLERHFKGGGQFYQTDDGVEVRLLPFTPEELPAVYDKYRVANNLQTEFGQLSEATKRLIADPLMLKFVAESYKGQALPADPRTVDVFERYFREKIGKEPQEGQTVARLVGLMYQAKSDELSEQALLKDTEIGQAVLASDSVNSPYFRLLDKAVLTRIQVGREGYAAAALFGGESAEQEVRVRFTYDRFFEYLLAFHVMPREVTVDRVKELTAEATRERFASLWGALKTRLIAYTEKNPKALAKEGVLAALAQEEDLTEQDSQASSILCYKGEDFSAPAVRHEIRGLMVDTLTSFGTIHPESVQQFLTQVLLQLGSESAGMMSVFAGYRLRMPQVFEAAYSHPSSTVRQAAMQQTYGYWSRYREQGEQFLDELTSKASSEVKRSLLRETLRKLAGESLDLNRLPILSAFLGNTLLLSGYLLTEPMAVKRLTQNLLEFYNSFGPAKDIVAGVVKRWAGDAAIEGWKSGAVATMDTLAIFTRRPLDDIRRKEVKEFAPCMGSEPRPIAEIADKMLEWSQIEDLVICLILVGILINRSIYESEATLNLLKRMFSEGNAMSQFNVLRTTSTVLQRTLHPCPGYLEFFNEAVLDVWTGTERTLEIEGKKYPLGHLVYPMIFECQEKTDGKIEFVDRMLALRWDGDKLSRLITVIEHLGIVGVAGFRMSGLKPYPVLETLSQWFHLEVSSPEELTRVQGALGRALARMWQMYPVEVEQFLEDEPELMIRMYEALRREVHGELSNFAGQGSVTSMVLLPAVLPGLVKVVQQICDEVTDVEKAVRMIGGHLVDPETIAQIQKSVEV